MGRDTGEALELAPELAEAMSADGADGMHATMSVDMSVVMSGTVGLTLTDGSKVVLSAGDTIIQYGLGHAWSNPGDEPAVVGWFNVGAIASTTGA